MQALSRGGGVYREMVALLTPLTRCPAPRAHPASSHLSRRVATFASASAQDAGGQGAPRLQLPYDLLVGADGANSAVRAKMLEHKVPGLVAHNRLSLQSVYK